MTTVTMDRVYPQRVIVSPAYQATESAYRDDVITRSDCLHQADDVTDLWSSVYDMDDDTIDGRLSRALQHWMPDMVVNSVNPRHKKPREPLYSAKLDEHRAVENSWSDDSIVTQISLLSCSSGGKMDKETTKKRRKRRQVTASTPETPTNKWVQFAGQRRTPTNNTIYLNQSLRSNAFAHLAGGNARYGYTSRGDLYETFDDEERTLLHQCGSELVVPGLRKWDSTANIPQAIEQRTRRASAGATKSYGQPLNFDELKTKKQEKKRHPKFDQLRRFSMRRISVASMSVPDTDSVPEVAEVSPPPVVVSPPPQMWKNEFTDVTRHRLNGHALKKVNAVNVALVRLTGYGEKNEQKFHIGRTEEFPMFVEEDYSRIPKMTQRIRLSPHLSSVIQEDVRKRMGRQKHQVIRKNDIEMWNQDHNLDRFGRNLKVFNWLHSLKEDEFDNYIEHSITDSIPEDGYLTKDEMIHVESCDEPDIKPMYAM